jgi:hypothetical protein
MEALLASDWIYWGGLCLMAGSLVGLVGVAVHKAYAWNQGRISRWDQVFNEIRTLKNQRKNDNLLSVEFNKELTKLRKELNQAGNACGDQAKDIVFTKARQMGYADWVTRSIMSSGELERKLRNLEDRIEHAESDLKMDGKIFAKHRKRLSELELIVFPGKTVKPLNPISTKLSEYGFYG